MNYCPPAWMFHIKRLSNCIRRKEFRGSCKMITKLLLNKNNCVRVCHGNLQVFGTETVKAKNDIAPASMKEVFQFKNLT